MNLHNGFNLCFVEHLVLNIKLLPCSTMAALCRRCLLNFCETVCRYFLILPFCVVSWTVDPDACALEDPDAEEEDRRDPGGSERALRKGFFLEIASLSDLDGLSLPRVAVEHFSPPSSLRALRQLCILLHLFEAPFSILSIGPCATVSGLAPVCHLYVLSNLPSSGCRGSWSTGLFCSGDRSMSSSISGADCSAPRSLFVPILIPTPWPKLARFLGAGCFEAMQSLYFLVVSQRVWIPQHLPVLEVFQCLVFSTSSASDLIFCSLHQTLDCLKGCNLCGPQLLYVWGGFFFPVRTCRPVFRKPVSLWVGKSG